LTSSSKRIDTTNTEEMLLPTCRTHGATWENISWTGSYMHCAFSSGIAAI
jgi:hypothetical protein